MIIMKLKHTLFREGTSLFILFRLYKCFEISLPVDDVKSLLVLRFLKPSTWFFNVRSNHLQNLMNSIQSLINVSVLLVQPHIIRWMYLARFFCTITHNKTLEPCYNPNVLRTLNQKCLCGQIPNIKMYF